MLVSQSPKKIYASYSMGRILISGILLLFIPFWEFFTQALADGFSQEFELQHVSRTLLSVLADLRNAVVRMVSTRPLISKSSSPCTNPLVTIPRAPITIGIIVTFMFHSFFNSLGKIQVPLFTFFQFYSVVSRDRKVHNSASSNFFFLFLVGGIMVRSGRLTEIKWSVCMSKSQRSSCVSFSRTNSGLCIY